MKKVFHLGAAVLFVQPAVVFAQAPTEQREDAAGTAAATSDAPAGEQDIVVTAQRRSQRIQDVPLSIMALGNEALQTAGIRNVVELGQIDPSISLNVSNGTVTPFFRGIGNPSGGFVGNESSVPVYIDNVYYARLNPAYLDLANVDRVEILKGPQGTLFGRNASGGLMHILTRDPGEAFAGEAMLGYGNYNTLTGRLYISGPVTENVAADLSISGVHQASGFGRNEFNGDEVGKNKYISVRSKWNISPTDNMKIKLIGYYVKTRTSQGLALGTVPPYYSTTPSFYGPPQIVQPAKSIYNTLATQTPYLEHEGYGGSAEINFDAGAVDLVSITAYRHANETYLAEGDYIPANFNLPVLSSIDRQFSQEFQVKSKSSSQVDWILGAYYLFLKQGYNPSVVTGDQIDAFGGPGAQLNIYGVQTIRSYSGYGQATFKVAPEGTNITLGLRYTSDHVSGEGRQDLVTGGGVFPAQALFIDKTVFNKLTYKVAVDHRFAPDILGYVSFSRGYKSGVYNTLPLTSGATRPEVVQTYEVGLKGSLFDRRVDFAVAVFQNDITDPQVQVTFVTPTTNSVGLANAGRARVRGAEFDTTLKVAEGLTARLSGAYLDAKYLQFENAPYIIEPTALPQNGGVCPGTVPGSAPVPATEGALCQAVPRDASGNRMIQVPKWRLAAGLNYKFDTSAGEFGLDVNGAYTSRFFWTPDELFSQEGYVLVNASVQLRPASMENLTIRAWVKNLTDKGYYAGAFATSGSIGRLGVPASPRTFGGDVTYRF